MNLNWIVAMWVAVVGFILSGVWLWALHGMSQNVGSAWILTSVILVIGAFVLNIWEMDQ
jgi:hypothetical protein